jgi:hypothetical protein
VPIPPCPQFSRNIAASIGIQERQGKNIFGMILIGRDNLIALLGRFIGDHFFQISLFSWKPLVHASRVPEEQGHDGGCLAKVVGLKAFVDIGR